MANLFNEKALDRDMNDLVTRLSTAIGITILNKVVLEPHTWTIWGQGKK